MYCRISEPSIRPVPPAILSASSTTSRFDLRAICVYPRTGVAPVARFFFCAVHQPTTVETGNGRKGTSKGISSILPLSLIFGKNSLSPAKLFRKSLTKPFGRFTVRQSALNPLSSNSKFLSVMEIAKASDFAGNSGFAHHGPSSTLARSSSQLRSWFCPF